MNRLRLFAFAAGALGSLGAFGQPYKTIQWTDNSDNEHGFTVERSIDQGATWEKMPPESLESAPEAINVWPSGEAVIEGYVGTTAADDSEWVDKSVPRNAEVSYRVLAYNEYGFSGYADPVSIATSTPPKPGPIKILLTPFRALVSLVGPEPPRRKRPE